MFFIFLFLIVHQITKMKTYLNHFLPELNCSFEFNLTEESLTIKCCTLFVSLIEYNLIAYIWSIYPSIHITFTSQRYQLTKLTVVDVYSIAMYLLTSFSREGRILPSRLTVRFILSDPSAVHDSIQTLHFPILWSETDFLIFSLLQYLSCLGFFLVRG